MNLKSQPVFMRTQTAPPEETTSIQKPLNRQQQIFQQMQYGQTQFNQFSHNMTIPTQVYYQQQPSATQTHQGKKQFEYIQYPPNIQKPQQFPQAKLENVNQNKKLKKKTLKVNSTPFSLNTKQNQNKEQNQFFQLKQKEIEKKKQKLQEQLQYLNKYDKSQENQLIVEKPFKIERVQLDLKKLEQLAKIKSKYSIENQLQIPQQQYQMKESNYKQNNQINEAKEIIKNIKLKKIIEENQEENIEESNPIYQVKDLKEQKCINQPLNKSESQPIQNYHQQGETKQKEVKESNEGGQSTIYTIKKSQIEPYEEDKQKNENESNAAPSEIQAIKKEESSVEQPSEVKVKLVEVVESKQAKTDSFENKQKEIKEAKTDPSAIQNRQVQTQSFEDKQKEIKESETKPSEIQNKQAQTEQVQDKQKEVKETKVEPSTIQNKQAEEKSSEGKQQETKESNTGPSAIQQLLFQGQKYQAKPPQQPQQQPQQQQIQRSQVQYPQQQPYSQSQVEDKGANLKYKLQQEEADKDFKRHKVDPKVSTFEFSEDHINLDETLSFNKLSGQNFSSIWIKILDLSLQKNHQIKNQELFKVQQRYQQFKKQVVRLQQSKKHSKQIKSNLFQNTQQQPYIMAQLQVISQYTNQLQSQSFTSTLIIQRQPEDPLKLQMQEQCNKWFSHKQGEKKDEIKKFQTEIRFQLNILTPQNLQGIQQTLAKTAETREHYQEIVKQIIEKAQSEPKYTKVYAELCSYLLKNSRSDPKDQENSQKKNQTSLFKTCLLSQIQKIFEGDSTEETDIKNAKQQEDTNEQGYKRKLLGNVRFIGELFLVQVIKKPVINICTYQVIRNFLQKFAHGHMVNSIDECNESENSLERILILYHQVGDALDKTTKQEEDKQYKEMLKNILSKLENYFANKDYDKILKWEEESQNCYTNLCNSMEKKKPSSATDFYNINFTFDMLKIFNKSSDLSKRMKCLIENIMQRRAENWKQFLSTSEGPKKLQELHDEFEQEQIEAIKQAQNIKEIQQSQKYEYQQKSRVQYKQKEQIPFQIFNESRKDEEKQNQSPVIDYSQYEKNAKQLNFNRDLNYSQQSFKPTQTQQQFTIKKLSETEVKAKLKEIYQKCPELDEQAILSLFTNSKPQIFMEQFFNTFYDAGEKEIQMRLKIPKLLLDKKELLENDFFEEFSKFLSIAANELQSDFKRLPIWCASLCYSTFLENNLANYIQINFYAMGTESQGLDWEIIDGAVTFYLDFIKELKFRLKLEEKTLQEQKLQDLNNIYKNLYDYLQTDFKANNQGNEAFLEKDFQEKLALVGFKEFTTL